LTSPQILPPGPAATAPRVLLIANVAAGVGHPPGLPRDLTAAVERGYGEHLAVTALGADNHPDVRAAAAAFLRADPGIVIAAGGGGTLRAVVEGVYDAYPAGPPSEVLLAALRMGSGNVVARRLGIPSDPLEGALLVGSSLRRHVTRNVGVIRCIHGDADGKTVVRHAVTMCGLGEWGKAPGVLASWRIRHAGVRRLAARVIGLERWNTLEYLWAGGWRLAAGTVLARRCGVVTIDGGSPERLLAGVVLNLPLSPLPDPRVEMGDAAAGATIIPRIGRPRRMRIEPGHPLNIKFLDPQTVEFFLDEDPEEATGHMTLEVPGAIRFLAGAAL
jgi:hypothetical protein